jgi:hypothetical protein
MFKKNKPTFIFGKQANKQHTDKSDYLHATEELQFKSQHTEDKTLTDALWVLHNMVFNIHLC